MRFISLITILSFLWLLLHVSMGHIDGAHRGTSIGLHSHHDHSPHHEVQSIEGQSHVDGNFVQASDRSLIGSHQHDFSSAPTKKGVSVHTPSSVVSLAMLSSSGLRRVLFQNNFYPPATPVDNVELCLLACVFLV